MSCPTCDHTMHELERSTLWCPRCGTIRQQMPHGNWCDDGVPKLVERCRTLSTCYITADEYPPLTRSWVSYGIAESINKPEDRK